MTTPVPAPFNGGSQPDVTTFTQLTQEMDLDPASMTPNELLQRATESSLFIATEAISRTKGILSALPGMGSSDGEKVTLLHSQIDTLFHDINEALLKHPGLQTLSPHEVGTFLDSKKRELMDELDIPLTTAPSPLEALTPKKSAQEPPLESPSPPGEHPGPYGEASPPAFASVAPPKVSLNSCPPELMSRVQALFNHQAPKQPTPYKGRIGSIESTLKAEIKVFEKGVKDHNVHEIFTQFAKIKNTLSNR